MDPQHIISDYLKWIKDNTIARTIEEGELCAISTPFLDRHNDHVEIYAQKQIGMVKLTDDGYTLQDLSMSGFEINTPKREAILKTVLNNLGVKLNGNNEIYVEATAATLGQKKHLLIQALLSVNDMFNLSQATVYSLFKEEVENYFRQQDVIFSKDIKLTGKSGFDHNLDFLIPATRTKPERLIKTLNTVSKSKVELSIFAFGDIAGSRDQATENYVVYNDAEHTAPAEAIEALGNYGIHPIAWSGREIALPNFMLN